MVNNSDGNGTQVYEVIFNLLAVLFSLRYSSSLRGGSTEIWSKKHKKLKNIFYLKVIAYNKIINISLWEKCSKLRASFKNAVFLVTLYGLGFEIKSSVIVEQELLTIPGNEQKRLLTQKTLKLKTYLRYSYEMLNGFSKHIELQNYECKFRYN